MQQRFSTRNYSVRDFEEWNERGELTLAPKFQRREVWIDKARSYLIDTIIRGKPIPKIYMRQTTNPSTRRTHREIVDGQQRLRTVLTFIKDAFQVSRAHSDVYGGKYYSDLDADTQGDVLKYEFVVDLLQDMPDHEVYDLFARINTYSERLKPQELRNAKFFGEFKSSAYLLANEFVTFFEINKVFSSKQILRMTEVEFVSELLLAIHEGIREGKKTVIDNCYKNYDDVFPNRKTHEKRFRETMDIIGAIVEGDLAQLKFRAPRLFYPLFCAVFHLKFGLPKIRTTRNPMKVADYPKLKMTLERVDALLDTIEAAERAHNIANATSVVLRFYKAYSEHWVHADNRNTMTEYLSRGFNRVLRG